MGCTHRDAHGVAHADGDVGNRVGGSTVRRNHPPWFAAPPVGAPLCPKGASGANGVLKPRRLRLFAAGGRSYGGAVVSGATMVTRCGVTHHSPDDFHGACPMA